METCTRERARLGYDMIQSPRKYYRPWKESEVLGKKPLWAGLQSHQYTGPGGDCEFCHKTYDEIKSGFDLTA